AGVDDLIAAAKAVGRVHRHRLEAIVAQMLLDLEHEVESLAPLALGNLDLERVVDLGQILVGEGDADDHAGHLLDGPYSLPVSVVLSHSSPFQSRWQVAGRESHSSSPCCLLRALSSKGLGAGDYLQNLLRDLRLTHPVHLEGQ